MADRKYLLRTAVVIKAGKATCGDCRFQESGWCLLFEADLGVRGGRWKNYWRRLDVCRMTARSSKEKRDE